MGKKENIIMIIIIMVIFYILGTIYFYNRFPPNIYINEINMSNLKLTTANEKLKETNEWDGLTIKSDKDTIAIIEAKNINYEYFDNPDLPKILNKHKRFKWILSLFKRHNYDTESIFIYNRSKVENIIYNLDIANNKMENAKIIYSDEQEKFVIQSHTYGLNIDKIRLMDMVVKSINNKEEVLNIEEFIEYPEILQDDEKLIELTKKANEYLKVELKYNYGDREEIVNKKLIKDWIEFEDGEIIVNPEKVREYIVNLANKYDTFGKSRKFKTTSGEIIDTEGGSYGWMTHRGKTVDELIKYIEAGESKTIEPVYSYKALIRDEDDIGNSYIEIDLSNQMVYVYIDGELKVETPTVTGNVVKGHATPTGVDPVNYKQRNAVLRGPGYASPVKYWMPFNGGIGLHDADWRTSFGGDIYKTNGSHGCINLPPNIAGQVYDLVYPGMPVIVY